MRRILIILSILLFSVTACTFLGDKNEPDEDLKTPSKTQQEKKEEKMEMNLIIDNKTFTVDLVDSSTTNELLEKLPIETKFSELNGNEYYSTLNFSLSTNTESIGDINAGDVMLYTDDTLVIFYESFTTPYSYSRIGHIKNTEGLLSALENDPLVRIEK